MGSFVTWPYGLVARDVCFPFLNVLDRLAVALARAHGLHGSMGFFEWRS